MSLEDQIKQLLQQNATLIQQNIELRQFLLPKTNKRKGPKRVNEVLIEYGKSLRPPLREIFLSKLNK